MSGKVGYPKGRLRGPQSPEHRAKISAGVRAANARRRRVQELRAELATLTGGEK